MRVVSAPGTKRTWRDVRLMSAIGTKRTSRDVRLMSANGGKADMAETGSSRPKADITLGAVLRTPWRRCLKTLFVTDVVVETDVLSTRLTSCKNPITKERTSCRRKQLSIIGRPQNIINMRPTITTKQPNITTAGITRKRPIMLTQPVATRSTPEIILRKPANRIWKNTARNSPQPASPGVQFEAASVGGLFQFEPIRRPH